MAFTPEVVYEDNHLIGIHKPSGILVQGDETGDVPLADHVKHYLKEKYNKPGEAFIGVVHRLDRPVSGLVMFAKTSKALSRMNELFRDRHTKKIYWAISDRKPARDEGTLIHWLSKDEKKNKVTIFSKEKPGALRCELTYRLLASNSGYYLLEVNPLTGRSHQIRAQLAAMGCPIVGDVKYGGASIDDPSRIYLHAVALQFVHPVKKEDLKVEAAVSGVGLWKYFNKLEP